MPDTHADDWTYVRGLDTPLPDGVVAPRRRSDPGGPTQWQTRSGDYRRTSRGLWVPADLEVTVDQRIVEAAARLPAHGAITGWAALRWCGAYWFEGTGHDLRPRPVPLAVRDHHAIRPSTTVEISQEIIPPGAVRVVNGLPVTCPLWSVAYEMRKAPTSEAAVVAFELAAAHDLVSIGELTQYVDRALWVRQGVPRVRELLPALEENSWSPTEPVMRLTWTAAGFARPLANHPVFTRSGDFVGTPDFLDPVAGVYGMYDGALHLAGHVRHADVQKEAAYRDLGLEGVTMMAGDLADRDAFVGRLRAAYDRASRHSHDARRWTTDLPRWWTPTFRVDQRRALSDDQRGRLLTYLPAA